MSRKDYIKLAQLIKDNSRTHNSVNRGITHVISLDIISDLCDMLKEDNPNFDEDRFSAACGVFPRGKNIAQEVQA